MLDKSSDLRKRAKRLRDLTYHDFWTLVVECSSILQEIAPTRRRLWLQSVIQELYEAQDGKCAISGEPLEQKDYEVDHIIPLVYGGGNERSNLQLVKRQYNRVKGKQVDPIDLLYYLEDRYMNL